MALDMATWRWRPDPERTRRVEAMAEELCRQSAHLAAAEYRWLRLLGEFDAEDGWSMSGARSLAAWLSWACGVSPAAARERVRVARALPSLPRICQSFAAGRLSYSKVRAITRVATPDNEELLVTYGESSTAAQLETIVRGYRKVERLEEAREAAKQFERRYLRHWVDDDGCVRIVACYPPDEGAFIVAQLERTAESGGEDTAAPPARFGERVSAETAEAGRGDAPVISARWDASEPADARRADALRLMAETMAADGPKAAVNGETQLVVLHVVEDDLQQESPAAPRPKDPATLVGPSIEGVGRVSAETARRIACDSSVAVLVEDALGRPLGVGRQSQTIPRRLRRALKRRDRSRCRFPGCPATRFVDAHHIKHWADGGPTDADNLVNP